MKTKTFVGNNEEELIKDVHKYIKDYYITNYKVMKLGGFNITTCDVPLLLSRFIKYDLEGIAVFKNKYDLLDARTLLDHDYKPKGSLEDYLKFFGLQGKLDGMNGSKVQELYNNGDWDTISEYSTRDSEIEYKLLEKIAPFMGFAMNNVLVFDLEFVVPKENLPNEHELFRYYCQKMPKNYKTLSTIAKYKNDFNSETAMKDIVKEIIFDKFRNKIISVSITHQ